MDFREFLLNNLKNNTLDDLEMSTKKEDNALTEILSKLMTTEGINASEYLSMNDNHFNAIRNLIRDLKRLCILDETGKLNYKRQLDEERKAVLNKIDSISFSTTLFNEIDSIKQRASSISDLEEDNLYHY